LLDVEIRFRRVGGGDMDVLQLRSTKESMTRKKKAASKTDEIMSLRLDRRRRRGIARVAKARHTSPSEVVRSAVDALLERAEGAARPYEGWSRVIGMVQDAPADLSEHTGAAFTAALRRRRNRT
jgi:hypothetical protein